MSDPMKTLRTRAKRAYEWTRLKRALLHATPALSFFVLLVLEGAPPLRVALSLLLYASAVIALWLGQGAGEAVLPSLVYGVVPFAIVRLAESSGHVCLGEACVSWCLPACVIGGVVGGALVGLRGGRASDRMGYHLASTTLVFLVGALGCQCAGNAGLLGMASGALMGAATPVVWRAWARR